MRYLKSPDLREWAKTNGSASYLVGTPKGRLGKLEGELLKLPWHKAREGVRVKLLAKDKELNVCVES